MKKKVSALKRVFNKYLGKILIALSLKTKTINEILRKV